MSRTFASLFAFLAAAVGATAATIWGLQFTGDTIARFAALTEVKANIRPSYVSSLQSTKAEALNVALAVPVAPVVDEATKPAIVRAYSHTVAVEALKVREGPRKSTRQVFVLKGGTPVNSIRHEGGWLMIDDGKGRTGWVYQKFLRPISGV